MYTLYTWQVSLRSPVIHHIKFHCISFILSISIYPYYLFWLGFPQPIHFWESHVFILPLSQCLLMNAFHPFSGGYKLITCSVWQLTVKHWSSLPDLMLDFSTICLKNLCNFYHFCTLKYLATYICKIKFRVN